MSTYQADAVEARLSAKDDGLTKTIEKVCEAIEKLNVTASRISEILIKARDAGASKTIATAEREAESLDKTKAETELAADDRASPKIEEAKNEVASLDDKKADVTLEASNEASPTIEKVSTAIEELDKTADKVEDIPVKAKDEGATKTISKVEETAEDLSKTKVEPVVTVKDQATPDLDKVEDKVEDLDHKSGEPTIDANDAPFTEKVKSVGEKLKGLSNITSTVAFGFLQSVGEKALSSLTSSLDGAISRYDTLQQFPKVMQQMGYSADDAQKNINKLSDGIDGLPTTLDGIAASAKNLSLTLGDMDKGADTAIAFNNAMLASGASTEDADRALTQYTQMLANGKVDMQSWMSMQTAGKYALTEVAKKLGIASGSTQELYDKLQSGSITMSEFNDALIETAGSGSKLADVARTSIEGIGTSLKNLANAGKKGLANLITQIDQQLAKSGTSVAAMIDGLKGAINGAFGAAGKVVEKVASVVEKIDFSKVTAPLAGLKSQLSETFDNFMNSSAIEGITSVFVQIAQGASEMAASITGALSTIDWSFLTGVFESLTAKFQAVIKLAGKFMAKMGETGALNHLTEALGQIGDAVFKVWDAMAESGVLDVLIDALVKVVDFASQAASAIAGFIGKMNPGALSGMTTAILGTVAGFKAFGFLKSFNPISGFVSKFKSGTSALSQITNKTKSGVQSAFEGIGEMFKSVGPGISAALQGASKAISGLNPVGVLSFAGVVAALTAAFIALAACRDMVLPFLEGLSDILVSFTGGILDAVVNAFVHLGDILPLIGEMFGNMAPFVTALGTALSAVIGSIEGLIGALGSAIAQIITAVTPIVEIVGGVFVDLADIIGGVIVQIVQAIAPFMPAITEMVSTVSANLPLIIEAFSNLLAQIGPIIDAIGNAVKNLGSAIHDVLSGISEVIDSVGNLIKDFFDGLSGVIDSVGQAALNAGEGFGILADGIVKITGLNLFDMAASLAAVAVGVGDIASKSKGLGEAGSNMMSLVQGLAYVQSASASTGASFAAMAAAITSSASRSASVVKSGASAIRSALTSGMTQCVTITTSALAKISSAMISAVTKMTAAGRQMGQGASNGLRSGMTPAAAYAAQACQRAVSAMSGYYSAAYQAGSYIGQGLANGIASQIWNVARQASALAAQADRAIQAKARIASPSKVTAKDGEFIALGLVKGMESMKARVRDAAESLVGFGSLASPLTAAFEGGAMSMDENYGLAIQVNPTLTLDINGREFAKATADDFDQINDQRTRLKKKLGGY